MSDSVRLQRQQPTRLLCPWNSPGKNTGVGCHFLLQCMKVKSEREVSQSCRLLATPWTAAYQPPPSMGFSRQEYWSGVPLGLHLVHLMVFPLCLSLLLEKKFGCPMQSCRNRCARGQCSLVMALLVVCFFYRLCLLCERSGTGRRPFRKLPHTIVNGTRDVKLRC